MKQGDRYLRGDAHVASGRKRFLDGVGMAGMCGKAGVTAYANSAEETLLGVSSVKSSEKSWQVMKISVLVITFIGSRGSGLGATAVVGLGRVSGERRQTWGRWWPVAGQLDPTWPTAQF